MRPRENGEGSDLGNPSANWVALLRGVNVGGKSKLPMASLVSDLAKIGLSPMRSYLQSGNLVFRASASSADGLAKKIGERLREGFGLDIPALVVGADEFLTAAAANPFPEAEGAAEGRALHLFFLEAMPEAVDSERLNARRAPTESWTVVGRVFYLHAPEGFHTSKLAAGVERILGVRATARNWRTVSQIREMVRGFP